MNKGQKSMTGGFPLQLVLGMFGSLCFMASTHVKPSETLGT